MFWQAATANKYDDHGGPCDVCRSPVPVVISAHRLVPDIQALWSR